MKRTFCMVLALLLLVLAAGCSQPAAPSPSAAPAEAPGVEQETPAQPDAANTESPADAEKPLKVALLVPGNLGDKSFFDMANAGMTLVKETLGAETKVVEMGTDQTKWEPTLLDFAEQDWDIIITGNVEIFDLLQQTALDYPEKYFINFDTSKEEVTSNMYSAFYKTNELSYMAGALAALKAKEAGETKIGFIGGMDIPGINDFLIGYIQGAQYVMPEVKVAISYAGSFTDAAKGKEHAIAMYNSGVGIIYQAAGQTGLGVIDAAKELNKLVIGVDSDQAAAFIDSDPAKADCIITSAVKRIDECILRAVSEHRSGQLYGHYEALGVKENGVGLAKNEIYKKLVSAGDQAKIDEIESKIAAGEITIDTAFGKETSEIETLRNSVRP